MKNEIASFLVFKPQQLANLKPRSAPRNHSRLKRLGEPSVRIDIVHLRGLQKRGDGRPGPAAMAARKEGQAGSGDVPLSFALSPFNGQ